MITLISFGYSKGMPAAYDVLFDARGIRNPHRRDPKAPDGRDNDIQKEVISDPKAKAIVRAVVTMAKERPDIRVAIGCRYGQHRSVAIVERIAKGITAFSDKDDNKLEAEVYHYDLDDEYETLAEKVLAKLP